MIDNSKPIYITGDFNINFHRNTNSVHKQRLLQITESLYLKQRVTSFTRITQSIQQDID